MPKVTAASTTATAKPIDRSTIRCVYCDKAAGGDIRKCVACEFFMCTSCNPNRHCKGCAEALQNGWNKLDAQEAADGAVAEAENSSDPGAKNSVTVCSQPGCGAGVPDPGDNGECQVCEKKFCSGCTVYDSDLDLRLCTVCDRNGDNNCANLTCPEKHANRECCACGGKFCTRCVPGRRATEPKCAACHSASRSATAHKEEEEGPRKRKRDRRALAQQKTEKKAKAEAPAAGAYVAESSDDSCDDDQDREEEHEEFVKRDKYTVARMRFLLRNTWIFARLGLQVIKRGDFCKPGCLEPDIACGLTVLGDRSCADEDDPNFDYDSYEIFCLKCAGKCARCRESKPAAALEEGENNDICGECDRFMERTKPRKARAFAAIPVAPIEPCKAA